MSRLAAIIFDRDENPDAALVDFIAGLRRAGLRVGGLVQESDVIANEAGAEHDIFVRDLDTGARLPIMQNLGPLAEGCRVDPIAIAEAANLLENARVLKPDLLVVNRFGRLETESGGMIAEIGRAVADGDALLICVPLRYRDAWNSFAGGLDVQVAPHSDALQAWWSEHVASNASA